MVKKVLFALCLALLSASASLAQVPDGELSPEMLELLAKEPPLTQADIDAFITVIPQLAALEEEADEDSASAIWEAAGLTKSRTAFIFSRISIAMLIAEGTPAEFLDSLDIPGVMKPDQGDVELVVKNREALKKVFEGFE